MRPALATAIGLSAIFCMSAAMAADLPTYKAPMAPEPVVAPFSWTGFYAGLNGGYDWGNSSNGWVVNSATIAAIPPLQTTVDATGSQKMNESGGSFGGQIGYLYQATPLFVIGGEATADWSGLQGSLNQGPIPIPGFPGYTFNDSQSLKVDWTASLRLRAGVTPTSGLLLYGLGGLAFASIQYSSVFGDTFNENESFSTTQTKTGYVVGAGAEYAFNNQWSVRAEYAFSQYGKVTGTGSGVLTDGTTAYINHSSGSLNENAIRFGVNYHFGN